MCKAHQSRGAQAGTGAQIQGDEPRVWGVSSVLIKVYWLWQSTLAAQTHGAAASLLELGWVWPSGSTRFWIRGNLSYSCSLYTILQIFIFLYSWRQGPARGATARGQIKALWQKPKCWQIFVGSFALHAGPGQTLLTLGQPMQENTIKTPAFMILPWIWHSTSKCKSYETFMPPIFLFSWSMLFGDETALWHFCKPLSSCLVNM